MDEKIDPSDTVIMLTNGAVARALVAKGILTHEEIEAQIDSMLAGTPEAEAAPIREMVVTAIRKL